MAIRLWAIKLMLVFILTGMVIVERNKAGWPILNWSMYSNRDVKYPENYTEMWQVRARTRNGDVHSFLPWDLLPTDRAMAIYRVIEVAFREQETKSQRYLLRLVRRALPGEQIEGLEGYLVRWDVEPTALPPLLFNKPVSAEFLGAYTPSPTDTEDGRAR
ncbi:MAG: hypothetical protein VX246_16595 [Myxococcota bacterium]|nr:hypothetical protein [Myxococcota bacterium]